MNDLYEYINASIDETIKTIQSLYNNKEKKNNQAPKYNCKSEKIFFLVQYSDQLIKESYIAFFFLKHKSMIVTQPRKGIISVPKTKEILLIYKSFLTFIKINTNDLIVIFKFMKYFINLYITDSSDEIHQESDNFSNCKDDYSGNIFISDRIIETNAIINQCIILLLNSLTGNPDLKVLSEIGTELIQLHKIISKIDKYYNPLECTINKELVAFSAKYIAIFIKKIGN